MTKKFVREEWKKKDPRSPDQEHLEFRYVCVNDGVFFGKASDSLVDLFQSFEDRITALSSLENKIMDLEIENHDLENMVEIISDKASSRVINEFAVQFKGLMDRFNDLHIRDSHQQKCIERLEEEIKGDKKHLDNIFESLQYHANCLDEIKKKLEDEMDKPHFTITYPDLIAKVDDFLDKKDEYCHSDFIRRAEDQLEKTLGFKLPVTPTVDDFVAENEEKIKQDIRGLIDKEKETLNPLAISRCPICEGHADWDRTHQHSGYYVYCDINEKCMFAGPNCETKEEAIEIWNKMYKTLSGICPDKIRERM